MTLVEGRRRGTGELSILGAHLLYIQRSSYMRKEEDLKAMDSPPEAHSLLRHVNPLKIHAHLFPQKN